MSPAAVLAPSRDRLERFRDLRAQLDPTGDPAEALGHYVDAAGSVSSRIAAELALAPASTHLLVGGVGSGKTTQLLEAHRQVSEIHDVRALYLDVSKQHDIGKMTPGVVVVQVGLALADALEGVPAAKPSTGRLREIANGYFQPWEPEYEDYHVPGDMVSGVLISPEQIDASVLKVLQPLEGLLAVRPSASEHLVVMLDGLDRMMDVRAFEQVVAHDLKALTSAGIGVVLVGPLRALYGLDRTLTEQFTAFHYQPWIDVSRSPEGRAFLTDVLRRRAPTGTLSEAGIEALVLASGGVLRDLLALAQAACVEAYLAGSERIDASEVARAIDTFGRKHLQGLRAAELAALHRVRMSGVFVQTSEEDLALLMTRRVLEYREQGKLRYAVHPTIEGLLAELDG